MSTKATRIYVITCYYGTLVTIATESYVYNFAALEYVDFLLVCRSLGATATHGMTCCHAHFATAVLFCCLKAYIFHIWYTYSFGQQQTMVAFVAMKALLPWQQKHLPIIVAFGSRHMSIFGLNVLSGDNNPCCYMLLLQ